MLNKDDKKFITDFITTFVRQEIGSLRDNLGEEIRHSGVQIEAMSDRMGRLEESNTVIVDHLDQVEKRLAQVEENTKYCPNLFKVVADHSRRIKKLEAKVGG